MLLDAGERDLLCLYAAGQLNALFPDRKPVLPDFLRSGLPHALERVEFCFSHIADRYFFDGERVLFNYLHGDQRHVPLLSFKYAL